MRPRINIAALGETSARALFSPAKMAYARSSRERVAELHLRFSRAKAMVFQLTSSHLEFFSVTPLLLAVSKIS